MPVLELHRIKGEVSVNPGYGILPLSAEKEKTPINFIYTDRNWLLIQKEQTS